MDALRIAGSGMGVVFASLLALTIVLLLLGRLSRRWAPAGLADGPAGMVQPITGSADGASPGDLEEVVAMAAALSAVEADWGPELAAFEEGGVETGPSAWMSQGRQRLMGSQGARPPHRR